MVRNAKIHLGGIPMIADDMMSYIKNDIVVFGIGVFIFIIFTLWMVFRNIKWVDYALTWLRNLSNVIMVGLVRFNWLESDSYILKFYSSYANSQYGNEHSRYCKISSIKKRI